MPNSIPFFLYRLENAHPGALGETMLIVTVSQDHGGGFIGEYRLLTAAQGGHVSVGQIAFDASLIQGLEIQDPVGFCKDETAKFAYSKVAEKLLAAEGTYGAASVFARPCSFVDATVSELRSMYLRGELKGKWGSVTKDCASDELRAVVRVWRNVNPLAPYTYDGEQWRMG
ncbi:TPA: hypothetical protein QDC20_003645 [Burkholderia aenigmatica]|uniref:hypothetical protein n=1 Tax=Burkholderia sp. AU45251 TaxID=3059204 RepID=UPI0026504AD6|nr:hypothetical protein [Burkholderia sp. AU45251]HDR9482828.1 hypothetical protein [Burkholderia aenigmatica]MDN7519488.1 hypothetical protein [Burkholderia sp. AU45251]HDR9513775.1 hypothetical protein [Burkholderia aenigmatica]HDR9591166.1 hypothetical protein [Burkholderia aenigmatica]HDR9599148.1 hypothetical protein [Burkholderia aenigmatica]